MIVLGLDDLDQKTVNETCPTVSFAKDLHWVPSANLQQRKCDDGDWIPC